MTTTPPKSTLDSYDTVIHPLDTVAVPRDFYETVMRSYKPRDPSERFRKFGNPTPLALCGLVMALTPLACQLMGWRGADSSGNANNGAHFFCGGLLMLLAGILEFFLGNTFAWVVYASYGGFFASLGATLSPGFGTIGAYTNADGSVDMAFYSSYAFFYLFMGLLSFLFLVTSIGTNICFVGIFLGYSIAFGLLAGADWSKASGAFALAHRCEVGGGAACFCVAIFGWWVLLSVMLETVGSPLQLPVGDLSWVYQGRKKVVDAADKA